LEREKLPSETKKKEKTRARTRREGPMDDERGGVYVWVGGRTGHRIYTGGEARITRKESRTGKIKKNKQRQIGDQRGGGGVKIVGGTGALVGGQTPNWGGD